jgi:putative transposase
MRKPQVAVYLHLVWATWDRLPLLQGDVQRQVYRAIGARCEELGVQIAALGGVEDHIHLLVLLPVTLSIADLVKYIKGSSSHLLAQHILKQQDGFFKWQGAYGAFSVSPHDKSKVVEYITHQREHHQLGSLNVSWELPTDEQAGG